MSSKKLKYFDRAHNVALKSDFKRVNIGCIAVYKSKIISTGFNTYKGSPLQMQYNQYRTFRDDYIPTSMHAEIACLSPIINLNIDFSRVELYIYRICKSRDHGIARPCPACMELIQNLGIRKIYYTGDDSFIYEEVDN